MRLRRHVADVVFVVAPQNRGWVLEGVAKDIARMHPGSHEYFYCDARPPCARSYFFTHYSLFGRFVDDPRVRRARSVVLFTHPSEPPLDHPHGAAVLANADIVISMSTLFARELEHHGVPRDRIQVLIPGVDPTRFRPHSRSTRSVGFSSAYYPRKSPALLEQIVRLCPSVPFRLLGRGWNEWQGLEAMTELPNFDYLELDLERYPEFYASIDVFVSPSELEGGPIPLLEAMMCNVVPVATATGFAPDLIEHGRNGYLCAVGSEAATFARLIDDALQLETDVRSTVVHHSADAFGAAVVKLL